MLSSLVKTITGIITLIPTFFGIITFIKSCQSGSDESTPPPKIHIGPVQNQSPSITIEEVVIKANSECKCVKMCQCDNDLGVVSVSDESINRIPKRDSVGTPPDFSVLPRAEKPLLKLWKKRYYREKHSKLQSKF